MTDNHFDIDSALAMVAGTDMNKFFNSQIDESDKQLVRDALENIFQGSSVILWIHGGTLQNAWNTALDNMRDEFFNTSRRDVFTVFLQRAVFEHRNKWHEKIRTNDNRAQTFTMLNLNKYDTDKMEQQANQQKLYGYDVITKLFLKYDGGFKATPKPNKNNEHTINREHTHEREERVRERHK